MYINSIASDVLKDNYENFLKECIEHDKKN